jgi:hypothetical protein
MAVTIKVMKRGGKSMEFSNRNVQSQSAGPSQATAPGAIKRGGGNKPNKDKWGRIGVVAAVAAVVILLVGLIVLTVADNSGKKSEDSYVNTSKLQAVFLNTGQVYFGNIKSLNNDYLVLTNIYYLQTSGSGSDATSSSNANVSLVKLGCELHEPFDQMVINSSQVTFWENLQDNGQVAQAVSTFEKQNPDGQKCADQSSSASNNSANNAQNANSNSSSSSTSTSNP